MPIDALSVLCAQLTRDLFAIAILILFAFHTNCGPILYHFGDKAINLWKIAISGQRYYGTLRLSVTFVTSQPTDNV